MKVRILHKFHDKADFNMVYLVGETVTFDDARAVYLISRGLVESAEEPEIPQMVEDIAPAQKSEIEPLFATPKAVKPVATRRKSTPKDK